MSSSVSLPHLVRTLPLTCSHLPLTWSQFMSRSGAGFGPGSLSLEVVLGDGHAHDRLQDDVPPHLAEQLFEVAIDRRIFDQRADGTLALIELRHDSPQSLCSLGEIFPDALPPGSLANVAE